MVKSFFNKINFFRYLLSCPLAKNRTARVLKNYLQWQIGARIVQGAVAIYYVNDTRLLAYPGMTGATCNIYVGLHEFEDMAFVLHVLRKDDFFVDIGSNIGSYTLLAGGAVGATCLTVEPVPETFIHLINNIGLNGLHKNVTALNIGLGHESGLLRFTSKLDTVNHVVTHSEVDVNTIDVPVRKLDDILEKNEPLVIKIDVEGFETNVILGAEKTLSNNSLLGVIMELNGSGDRYDFDENELHKKMLEYGFLPFTYNPFIRTLLPLNQKNTRSGNTLYLRNIPFIEKRLKEADKYHIRNVDYFL